MPWRDTQSARLRRLFLEGFSAMDLAEPLVSFDAGTSASEVQQFMASRDFDLVGVRRQGWVTGYVRREDLSGGTCADYLRPFTPEDDLVTDTANLIEVVKSLSINQKCFVTILGRVGAIITLDDLEKPPMRMFLFGMITIGEMVLTELIRNNYPEDSWQQHLSAQRLEKARELQQERLRRGQAVALIDCLQYGDKGWILSYNEEFRRILGQNSRKEARQAIKEMEILRNNLAHTQQIIPSGWKRIVIACSRMERNLEAIRQMAPMLNRDSSTE